ncbi:hypothetical protein EHW99_2519 [Erwinia amylovora]|uniref:Uncharacterized protein n=3 Tax=Erwinia amylovora TaxID=552 RepID=A0A830ZRG1_ERWAM|nr:hypothetical protein EaACW_1071 [Erwinia amylovora ACW56400]QJQ55221.1 hypothetical protein EHX00_2519 [Erwinia amylovora]CBA20011.1 hypothetical protein predicted by Glimmer/Critica [Erwinia amylovora CFBP1430]CBX79912.1 hypothetical protein predicted by Glimmer/Critica [Erwinia amylovora ATCC BAA-2158]CCO77914.1 hypothetical protein BN432_1093 [Erwinia amylovora Ea356]CCO81701.1 hypothetical protein BN433_1107 [Erwinia amylovora Ea266]CCO85505.1 hypothetical protein BN434_1094 [Erwinia a
MVKDKDSSGTYFANHKVKLSEKTAILQQLTRYYDISLSHQFYII